MVERGGGSVWCCDGWMTGGCARKTQSATAVDIFALYKTVISAK